jgi:sulfatase modifying factor 1
MTLGRLATFLGILVVSVATAGEIMHRRGPYRSGRDGHFGRHSSVPKAPPVAVAPLASGRRADNPPADIGLARQVDPLTDALCSEGMVLVDGTTCGATAHRCKVLDPASPGRCLSYEPAVCRPGLELRFCIDRDEYPNQEGMLPAAMVTFEQALAACKEEDKRLCTETEWSLSCEGQSGFVFPHGNDRDPSACNVERKVPRVRPEEVWEPRDVSAVLERVDARTASGAMPRCVSPFGVRDMTGNVEEWVESDTASAARTLRGGEYTSDPTCATVRKLETPGFRQFHTGFRCCRDPLVRVPRRKAENGAGIGRPVAPQGRFD